VNSCYDRFLIDLTAIFFPIFELSLLSFLAISIICPHSVNKPEIFYFLFFNINALFNGQMPRIVDSC